MDHKIGSHATSGNPCDNPLCPQPKRREGRCLACGLSACRSCGRWVQEEESWVHVRKYCARDPSKILKEFDW